MRVKKLTGMISAMALFLLLTVLPGCGQAEDVGGHINVYYISMDGKNVVPVDYVPESKTTEDMVSELLKRLSEESNSVDYHRAIAGGVEVESFEISENQLSLTFNEEYLNMDPMTEVLCRCAVVSTLTAVPDISRVVFYVGEEPCIDVNGNNIGPMTADTFVMNPGEQINSFQETDVTLYFSNPGGDGLVTEVQEVHYSSNISMQKLVLERLMAGPLTERCRDTIPEGTRLLSVNTVDGVCYVNFDAGFLNQDYGVSEAVMLYSIVDSLTELPDVNKVQISVNGDASGTLRSRYSLSTQYERDLSNLEE